MQGSKLLYIISPPTYFFQKDELHILLKRRNFEICKHSSFFLIIDVNKSWSSDISKLVKVPKLVINPEFSMTIKYILFTARHLKIWQIHNTDNHLGGLILYINLDLIKNSVRPIFARIRSSFVLNCNYFK